MSMHRNEGVAEKVPPCLLRGAERSRSNPLHSLWIRRFRTRATLPLILCLCACSAASADEIILPSRPLARNETIEVVYRLQKPMTGKGVLDIEWTDSYGRIVERRRQ